MDPNATLIEAIELLMLMDGQQPASWDQDYKDEAAEKLEALAEWLRKGGFAPMISDKPFATSTHSYYLKAR